MEWIKNEKLLWFTWIYAFCVVYGFSFFFTNMQEKKEKNERETIYEIKTLLL